jgi:hypothetical protein
MKPLCYAAGLALTTLRKILCGVPLRNAHGLPLCGAQDFIRRVGPSSQSAEDESSRQPFAVAPASWYYFGPVAELASGPQGLSLPDGQSFVAFHPPGGVPAVLSARCSHMGRILPTGV